MTLIQFNLTILAFLLGATVVRAAETEADAPAVSINTLNWLSGEWIGEGREGEDGNPQGVARLYWTPAAQGAMSSTFTWVMEDKDHIHYALNVFQQDGETVKARGIHYGADFETFEEQPWEFLIAEATQGFVKFRCIAYCRAKTVTYTLTPEDGLIAVWDPVDDNQKDWIERYKRISKK